MAWPCIHLPSRLILERARVPERTDPYHAPSKSSRDFGLERQNHLYKHRLSKGFMCRSDHMALTLWCIKRELCCQLYWMMLRVTLGVMERGLALGQTNGGYKFWLCYFVALWLWASQLPPLSLCFFIENAGINTCFQDACISGKVACNSHVVDTR